MVLYSLQNLQQDVKMISSGIRHYFVQKHVNSWLRLELPLFDNPTSKFLEVRKFSTIHKSPYPASLRGNHR